jgi:CBS domain-containing protein
MNVRDVMTRDVVTVTRETPLIEVARLLGERRISGIPVMADGVCVGVVSEADLLAKQLSRTGSHTALDWIFGVRPDPEEARRRAARTAAEAMSAPPLTISPQRPLRDAAALMVDRGVNRLPVIDDGRLVGIVTRADLVRAYLHLDEEIGDSIREKVLRTTMWLEPADFTVDVSEGRVRISGRVDRRSTAQIVQRLIGLVDGVVHVDGSISWELDDTRLAEPLETESEPGAASLADRDARQPLHR